MRGAALRLVEERLPPSNSAKHSALAHRRAGEPEVAMEVSLRHLPQSHRPSSARGQVIHDKIVSSAYRLFVERGFNGVSVEQIADTAGVSRRTFYNKFASKAEIYRVAFDPVLARLELAANVGPSGSDDAYGVLRHYTLAVCTLLSRAELIEVLRALMHDWEHQPWLAQAYVERVRVPIRTRFADEIRRLVMLGELPDNDVCVLTERFFATALGIVAFPRLLQFDARDGHAAAAEFVRSSMEALLAAWKAPAGATPSNSACAAFR